MVGFLVGLLDLFQEEIQKLLSDDTDAFGGGLMIDLLEDLGILFAGDLHGNAHADGAAGYDDAQFDDFCLDDGSLVVAVEDDIGEEPLEEFAGGFFLAQFDLGRQIRFDGDIVLKGGFGQLVFQIFPVLDLLVQEGLLVDDLFGVDIVFPAGLHDVVGHDIHEIGGAADHARGYDGEFFHRLE